MLQFCVMQQIEQNQVQVVNNFFFLDLFNILFTEFLVNAYKIDKIDSLGNYITKLGNQKILIIIFNFFSMIFKNIFDENLVLNIYIFT